MKRDILIFPKFDNINLLQNVVKLSTIGIEYQNGRVVPYVCAITSDGITHIIDYATQE